MPKIGTRRRTSPGEIVSKILLAIVGFIFCVPFLWMFASSLKPSLEVLSGGTSLIGSQVRWDNYATVFDAVPFARIIVNTFVISILGALVATTVSLLSGYAFARLNFPGRAALFSAFIATLMLPSEVLIIPLFIGARQVGVLNTYTVLILPFAFGAFGSFLLRQFILQLPSDFEEAARIDGAGHFRSLFQVVLPLLRAPLAIVFAFAFIDYWNQFLWPLVAITDMKKAPMQLGLSMFSGERGTDWGPLMAACSLSVFVSLFLVVFLQRQIANGSNAGGFGGR